MEVWEGGEKREGLLWEERIGAGMEGGGRGKMSAIAAEIEMSVSARL